MTSFLPSFLPSLLTYYLLTYCDTADYVDRSPGFGRRSVVRAATATNPPVSVVWPGTSHRRPGSFDLQALPAERRPTPASTATTAPPFWSPPLRRAFSTSKYGAEKVSQDFDPRGSTYPTFATFLRYSSLMHSSIRFRYPINISSSSSSSFILLTERAQRILKPNRHGTDSEAQKGTTSCPWKNS